MAESSWQASACPGTTSRSRACTVDPSRPLGARAEFAPPELAVGGVLKRRAVAPRSAPRSLRELVGAVARVVEPAGGLHATAGVPGVEPERVEVVREPPADAQAPDRLEASGHPRHGE